MGSSSSSREYIVKDDLYDLPEWYIKERFNLCADVSIYSSRIGSSLGLAKHHGIIV